MVAKITDDNLGAWLIRCNPVVWDLAGFIEDGGEWIDDWSVVDNYRSRMMKPGDRVVFWATGSSPSIARGIWGTGHINSHAYDDIPDDPEAVDVGYWLDEHARLGVTTGVDVHIPLFEQPVTDRDLKASGINDLEVQIQPQISNPSWVSKDQLARLEALLPPWPEQTDVEDEITVSRRGAGFGDPETNRVVEAAAIAAVTQFYESSGWAVQDVSSEKSGWDLTCTHPIGELARVEVKGVRGDRPVVLLTANEIRAATVHHDWYLAVVTRALSDPEVSEFEGNIAVNAAKAFVYRAELPMTREASPE